MRFRKHNGAYIIAVIQLLSSLAFAAPNLGIRADSRKIDDRDSDKIIQSYSGIIKFDDGAIPLDKTKMTDAKLLHLCVLAYNEMVNIWRPRNLISDALPGAMAAIAYKDTIYFASAVRAPAAAIKLAHVAKGSVRQMMDDAFESGLGRSSPSPTMIIWAVIRRPETPFGTPVLHACSLLLVSSKRVIADCWTSLGTHAHSGGCSEINCIELLWTHNGQQDPDKGPPAPRVAIWVLPRNRRIDTNSEINAKPCTWGARSGVGYGCADIVLAYGLDPIDSTVAPDAAGEDDWRFSLASSPRPPCR